jgi:hypothetical protein
MKLIRIWIARICLFNFFQEKKGTGYSLMDIWQMWKKHKDKRNKM